MPGNDALEPGALDPVRVPALRARLAATDPVAAALRPADPAVYDEDLVAAVRRFQAAEALEADGRAGRMTFTALNRPAEATSGSSASPSTCAAPRPMPGRSGGSR